MKLCITYFWGFFLFVFCGLLGFGFEFFWEKWVIYNFVPGHQWDWWIVLYLGRKYMWILNWLIIRSIPGMLQVVDYFFQACSGHISNDVHLSCVGPLPHVELGSHVHVSSVCRSCNIFITVFINLFQITLSFIFIFTLAKSCWFFATAFRK